MEPEWINIKEAIRISKEARLSIGQIATLKIQNKEGVWDFFASLRISKDDYRFFETEKQAEAARILRGLTEPETVTFSSQYGNNVYRPTMGVGMTEYGQTKSKKKRRFIL